MDFHQLLVFTKVAEKQSFSRAAEDLFLSQSTVSTHIGSLEKHFGQKLFDRLGREVALTPFGEKLHYWAQEILKLQDMAIWDLKEWTGKAEGNISIGAGTVPAQFIAPFLMSRYLLKYPGITFTLTQNSSEAVADSLLKSETDLGMLGEKYYSDRIDYIPLLDENLVLITPPKVILRSPVSIYYLLEHNFIFRKPGSGTQAVLEKILRKQNMSLNKLKVIAYFDNVQSIKQAVKENMGLSIVSEIAALDYKESGFLNVYKLVELKEKRTFYFGYHKKKSLPPYISEFITFGKNMVPFLPWKRT